MIRRCLEKRGMLKLLILQSLAERPLHVYGIIKSLERVIGAAPSAGAVYPALKSLERAGLVAAEESAESGRRARLYKVTQLGLKHLQEREKELKELNRMITCWNSFRQMGGEKLFRLIREVIAVAPKLSEDQRERLRGAILDFEIRVLSIVKEVKGAGGQLGGDTA
ncbi:MAG: PadR family transcriptional regulator [Thermofilum sp.]